MYVDSVSVKNLEGHLGGFYRFIHFPPSTKSNSDCKRYVPESYMEYIAGLDELIHALSTARLVVELSIQPGSSLSCVLSYSAFRTARKNDWHA